MIKMIAFLAWAMFVFFLWTTIFAFLEMNMPELLYMPEGKEWVIKVIWWFTYLGMVMIPIAFDNQNKKE